jgi:thymidylate synthase
MPDDCRYIKDIMNKLYNPYLRVEEIRTRLASLYSHGDFVVDKSGCKMVELVGAQFLATNETIFGKVDYDYIDREIMWYLSQDLNISGLGGTPPKEWIKSADSLGFINSNYGWAILSEENYQQFWNVYHELIEHRDSRRAVMIYNRPIMWYDYKRNGRNDFMCTNDVQYLIRDDQLHCIVNMRSNDAIYGYKNDLAWQKYVLALLCGRLNEHEEKVEAGNIIWNAGSLHVYERHFPILEYFIRTGNYRPSKLELEDYDQKII